MMHHDTITGTSKQAVIDDNRNILRVALKDNEKLLNQTILNMLKIALNASSDKVQLNSIKTCFFELESNEDVSIHECTYNDLT